MILDYEQTVARLSHESLGLAAQFVVASKGQDPARAEAALEYLLGELARLDDPGDLFATQAEWVAYRGPREGKGWRSTKTGEVLYQEEQPGRAKGRLSALTGALARLFGKKGPKEYAPPVRTTEDLEKRAAGNKDYQATAKKIEEKNAPVYEQLAAREGMSVPELKKHIAGKVQRLADGMSVYARLKDETLGKILESGRFKTQHETGTSNGTFDPKLRAEIENKSQGAGPDTAPEHRPVSAYLAPHDFAHGKSDAAANRYGGVMVKLKDSVRERSQATVGDSAQFGSNEYGVATPLKRIGHLSVDPHQLRHSGMDILDSHEKLSKVEGLSFIEALVHGGLDLKDIDEVGFRETPPKEVQDKLKSHGLKWRVYRG